MASVIWDARGIIFIDYLQVGKTKQQRVLCELITAFEWGNQEKTAAFGGKESVVSSR